MKDKKWNKVKLVLNEKTNKYEYNPLPNDNEIIVLYDGAFYYAGIYHDKMVHSKNSSYYLAGGYYWQSICPVNEILKNT